MLLENVLILEIIIQRSWKTQMFKMTDSSELIGFLEPKFSWNLSGEWLLIIQLNLAINV